MADAPVGALVDAADEVAKAWLLELVAAAPLSAAGGVRMAELAAEGPELCAAVARALGDDQELERLRGDGDMVALAARAGALAGAADAAAASAAVEALRRAVWDAALGELSRPPAALVADLADRLGAVCAAVVAAVLGAPVASAEAAEAGEAGEREPVLAGAVGGSVPRRQHTIRESLSAGGMDRLADLARAAAEEAVHAADLRAETLPIMRPPLESEPAAPEGAPRVTDGDPRTHLAARTAEFVADGRPFAVLLVEIDGLDALLASEHDGEVAAALAAAERALEDLVRPGDAIRRESDGRLWLTLPGAGPAGARALALRAAAAVERGADHRGRPLSASVGVAVCPRDGADAETLAERVEDDLLGAQAAGTHGAPPPAL